VNGKSSAIRERQLSGEHFRHRQRPVLADRVRSKSVRNRYLPAFNTFRRDEAVRVSEVTFAADVLPLQFAHFDLEPRLSNMLTRPTLPRNYVQKLN
jgi:hypothetical protein